MSLACKDTKFYEKIEKRAPDETYILRVLHYYSFIPRVFLRGLLGAGQGSGCEKTNIFISSTASDTQINVYRQSGL